MTAMVESVAIVGNGPTAAGKGQEIDACDFVIRLKSFWIHGAEDVGTKTNAVCWYGVYDEWRPFLPDIEHWITQEPCLFRNACELQGGNERLERIVNMADGAVIRWMPTIPFCESDQYIGRSPTTGFTAINMAIRILRPRVLHLFGFDATTRGKPNYDDARRQIPEWTDSYHDMGREKRVIAELFRGFWLGKPCETQLYWHDMPEGIRR